MLSRNCETALKEGWKDREGFKCCGYCGSMDPVELAELVKAGKATLHGSDWKYGWPHKFYVEVENPHPEKQVYQWGRYCTDENGIRQEEEHYGPQGPILHLKFYSEHLGLLNDESFAKVAPIISEACGIVWEKKEGKLYYAAPHHNYQK